MIDDLSDFWNAFVHCSRATLHWAYATVYSAWVGVAIHQTHEKSMLCLHACDALDGLRMDRRL